MTFPTVLVLMLSGCGGSSQQIILNGAGATFPYPIYSKWFDEYRRERPNVQINYQAIGSGGGIRQLEAGTVNFGATDSPMTDEQLKRAQGAVLHFPSVLGAVVPTYNVPGSGEDLNFTGRALARIMLGTIRRWDDPEIREANPGINLPSSEIVVVHRSDGSGTTFIWTDFLSKTSPEWKSKVGTGTAVNWPLGLGGKGNEGVSGLVSQTPYSIGYVELVYALQNKLAYGRVQNVEGEFVKAGLASVTAAASGAAEDMPSDFRVSITNAPGKGAYPISSFTWLLIPEKMPSPEKAQVMRDFLNWMLEPGQKIAQELSYAPLPQPVISKILETITRIQ